jgi:hypothetical protein
MGKSLFNLRMGYGAGIVADSGEPTKMGLSFAVGKVTNHGVVH